MDERQLETGELLVALLYLAAEEHLAVELPHDEFEQVGRLREHLDEGRVAGELVQHVAGRLPLGCHLFASRAGEQSVDHGGPRR